MSVKHLDLRPWRLLAAHPLERHSRLLPVHIFPRTSICWIRLALGHRGFGNGSNKHPIGSLSGNRMWKLDFRRQVGTSAIWFEHTTVEVLREGRARCEGRQDDQSQDERAESRRPARGSASDGQPPHYFCTGLTICTSGLELFFCDG